LIPIIIVALVIGSVIAFAVFSTTITTTTPAKIFSNMTEVTKTTTTQPSERLNNQDNNIHGILANVASGRCYRISPDKI
jgi:hypothetical protein